MTYMENRRVLNAEELLEKIFSFMNEMVDTKDFASTILLLTELGRTLANSERASFWYWDKAKKQYWTLVALDSPRIVVPEGSGIVGASISGNETILINNPYEDPRFNPEVDRETGYQTRSILCIPVTNSRGEVIGAYQAINKMDDKGYWYFDDRDERRLAMAAVFCGKTLESQILYGESQLDQLTGLKNRRGYYEYYEKNILPYLLRKSCSIVMGDIDFFKRVNDTYGHNAGALGALHKIIYPFHSFLGVFRGRSAAAAPRGTCCARPGSRPRSSRDAPVRSPARWRSPDRSSRCASGPGRRG